MKMFRYLKVVLRWKRSPLTRVSLKSFKSVYQLFCGVLKTLGFNLNPLKTLKVQFWLQLFDFINQCHDVYTRSHIALMKIVEISTWLIIFALNNEINYFHHLWFAKTSFYVTKHNWINYLWFYNILRQFFG